MDNGVKAPPGGGLSLSGIARALKYRNYRLYFSGQSVSLVGTWIQHTAMSWLVYKLTKSPFLMGIVAFSGQIPMFVLTPFAGVLADRMDRQKILIVSQVLAMLQALAISALVLANRIEVWHVIALSIFLGVVNAFDAPARQSFIVEIVDDRSDLGNAIALNSTLFNGARLIGPSIAGLVINAVGEGVCFLLNGLSYVGVLIALAAIKVPPHREPENKINVLAELKEGFQYVLSFSPIRAVIMLVALTSLAGMPYMLLLPIFTANILGGGPKTLGFLMGSVGMGALAGSFYLAARKGIAGLGRIIPAACALFGAGLVAFSQSTNLYLSMLLLFVTGMGMIMQVASSNTILQAIVEDSKRGRVMSIFAAFFMGLFPFGSLIAGSLAHHVGAPATVMAGGLICIAGALVFARNLPLYKEKMGPAYASLGI
jgi:MFS family permease